MYYIIYIDVYFFVNFFMNILLLYLLCKSEGERTGYIPLAAFFGGTLSCLFVVFIPQELSFNWILWVNGVLDWLMVCIVFRGRSIKRRFRLLMRFGLLEILLGGILKWMLVEQNEPLNPMNESQDIRMLSVIASGTVAVWVLLKVIGDGQKEKQVRNHLYPVKLCHAGKEVEAIALLDTGNHLREPVTGKPVVVVESCVAGKLLGEMETARMMSCVNGVVLEKTVEDSIKLIPFHSLGKSHGIMPGRTIEKMILYEDADEKICEKVLIGIMGEELSGDGLYQIILHEAYIK